MTPEVRTVAANGVRLGYEVHSEGSGKPPAVFVHGYGFRSTGAYPELIATLAREFTVYALDLRGHGASAAVVDDWSLTAVADDVAAFAQELGLVDALYIGHSIGGFTGMYTAVRHPGVFSALCLLTPASAGGGGHTPPEIGQAFIEHGKDPEFLKNALAGMYVHNTGTLAAQAETAALIDRRVHQAFFAEYPQRIIIDEVGQIECPVLMLNGGLDNVVPLTEQHRTALALRNCKEVNFMTEGHMLPVEAPDIAAREIIAFWKHGVGQSFARESNPN